MIDYHYVSEDRDVIMFTFEPNSGSWKYGGKGRLVGGNPINRSVSYAGTFICWLMGNGYEEVWRETADKWWWSDYYQKWSIVPAIRTVWRKT